MQLLYSSDITVNPEHWNPKKEEIKVKILMDPAERAEFNRTVALRKSQITDLYNAAPDKSVLTSEWLSAEMYKLLHPVVKNREGVSSFFEDFDYFLETRKLSDVRTRNFRVIYRALQRFELRTGLPELPPVMSLSVRKFTYIRLLSGPNPHLPQSSER